MEVQLTQKKYLFAASTYCIVTGHEWSGSILGIGGLTGLVTAFIKGRSHQEKNLEEKRPRSKKQELFLFYYNLIY